LASLQAHPGEDQVCLNCCLSTVGHCQAVGQGRQQQHLVFYSTLCILQASMCGAPHSVAVSALMLCLLLLLRGRQKGMGARVQQVP
jgi:hypothetical protein